MVYKDIQLFQLFEKDIIFFIIGALAVMKVGDAFVYINPRYPEERKKYLVSEVKAKLVLKYLSTPQNLFDSLDIFEYDLDNHDYHLYDNNLPLVNQILLVTD